MFIQLKSMLKALPDSWKGACNVLMLHGITHLFKHIGMFRTLPVVIAIHPTKSTCYEIVF